MMNYLSDLIVIWTSLLIYQTNNFYGSFLNPKGYNILFALALVYTAVLPYFSYKKSVNGVESTSMVLLKTLWRLVYSTFKTKTGKKIPSPNQEKLNQKEKLSLLSFLVKFYFIPIMIAFSINNYNFIERQIALLAASNWQLSTQFFNNNIYPFALCLLFLIDTLFFTFGYLVESDLLKNKIRSVDSTFLGWFFALICYPPFSDSFSRIAPWYTNDMAFFVNDTLTFLIRCFVMSLVIIYVGATINLGFKCSNLTNRGIVSKGFYSFVRHPAYASKVLMWWVISLPFFSNNFFAAFSMLFWTGVYFMRARTEEKHLSSDIDYVNYCQKVKYRFIPMVY